MNSYFLTVGSYILTLDENLLIGIAEQLFNTCLLCAILSFLLYKPVLKFMRARKQRISDNITEADSKLKEAERVLNEYNERMKDIQAERSLILEAANKEANANKALIIEQAKKEAADIKNRAKLQIARDEEKARDKIRLQIIEVSSLIAAHFVDNSLSDDKQTKLVDDVIKGLGDVKWQG